MTFTRGLLSHARSLADIPYKPRREELRYEELELLDVKIGNAEPNVNVWKTACHKVYQGICLPYYFVRNACGAVTKTMRNRWGKMHVPSPPSLGRVLKVRTESRFWQGPIG